MYTHCLETSACQHKDAAEFVLVHLFDRVENIAIDGHDDV